MKQKPPPQLGWTQTKKLTANGQVVRVVFWLEGVVILTTDSGDCSVETGTFEQFVSVEWDPNKPWFYTTPR